jgi:hypothetical protein
MHTLTLRRYFRHREMEDNNISQNTVNNIGRRMESW